MRINKKTFLISILIPALFLIALTVKPLATIVVGQEILLDTKAFDPRDVFRGDYISLSYEIEEITLDKFPVEFQNKEFADIKQVKKATNNGIVYGVLKIQNKQAEMAYITFEPPTDKTYIKGKLDNLYQFVRYQDINVDPKKQDELTAEEKSRLFYVDFGLDKYFVPENTGQELEKKAREGEIIAKIKLLKGYGILTDIE